MEIILQIADSLESRCISSYAALHDNIKITRCHLDDLLLHKLNLKLGAMPVGSVEFVSSAFRVMGVDRPKFNPYDRILENHWMHTIDVSPLKNISADLRISGLFVKPVELKLFNGFIYYGDGFADYDDHDLEQLNILKGLPGDQLVYTSKVIQFVAEWRCYMTDGKLKATCRYDANENDYTLDTDFLQDVVNCLPGKTIACDIGLTAQGQFCMVELNDAWAIGQYRGISNADYFNFLATRWSEILAENHC